MVNCKVGLKLKWTKYCVLSASGNDNVINKNNNANNFVFTIKYRKLYVPDVNYQQESSKIIKNYYQKSSKLLRKRFERSIYWNECKTKTENKNTANE